MWSQTESMYPVIMMHIQNLLIVLIQCQEEKSLFITYKVNMYVYIHIYSHICFSILFYYLFKIY